MNTKSVLTFQVVPGIYVNYSVNYLLIKAFIDATVTDHWVFNGWPCLDRRI